MSKILIWETLSNIGGGQEMTLKVADVLKAEHELHFLIPEEGRLSQELKNMGIPYTLMGDQSMPKGEKGIKGLFKFAYLTVFASIKGRKAVKQIKPDILYAPGPAALVWSAMCANRKIGVIWHLHHMFQSGPTLKLLNIFSASKCVKRIISASNCVADQIHNKKAESKKVTIYNPVKRIPEDIKRKNLCDEYPSLDKELKIAQVAFITPTKGQDVSLSVLENLKSSGVDASLAIIGSVREGDDDFKAMLDEKIKVSDLTDNVVFTGFRNDIDEIIGTFDVLFVPSVIEGFSLAAAQAIMENVPVLSIDKTGCTEVVEKSNCGMVYSGESEISVIADTLLKTASLDIKSIKEKHPDFLLSECSKENFSKRISKAFVL